MRIPLKVMGWNTDLIQSYVWTKLHHTPKDKAEIIGCSAFIDFCNSKALTPFATTGGGQYQEDNT